MWFDNYIEIWKCKKGGKRFVSKRVVSDWKGITENILSFCEGVERYLQSFSKLFRITLFNPLADAPMCGRWSVNKNFEREISKDENTRTLETNGPINREEKRCAQPQTLLNLWSASNVAFENILLRSSRFRNFWKWIVINRDESFKVVSRPRWNISNDFNSIRHNTKRR